MTIDRFTKEQFESALPIHKDTNEPLWISLSIKNQEYAYLVPINGGAVAIEVRSSIDRSEIAADTGKDSIRAWLVDTETGRPIGSKVSRWTTRVPGWENRLTDVLRTLWQWRMRAGDCPECGEPKGIYKVKKEGKNKGRPFANCRACDNGFVWLDEKPKTSVYFNHNDDDVSSETDEQPIPEIRQENKSGDDSSVSEGEGRELPTDQPPPSSSQTTDPRMILSSSPRGLDIVVDDEYEDNGNDESVIKLEPNENQLWAITAPIDKAVRVLAPPGAGKTKVIADRYAFLLENGAEPKDVLAVTFSKTMADELLSRIKRVSPQVTNTVAENQICTIHAICYRMLKDSGDKRSVAKDWQCKKIIEELSASLWPYANEKPGWKEILHWINVAKFNGLSTSDDLQLYIGAIGEYHGRNLHDVRRQFDERLSNQRLLTFTDMLFAIEQKLNRDTAFRMKWQERFKWLIIDEGQDVSGQAMRILSTLAEPQKQFFIVGDSDQLLFRFCGSTPEANLFDGFDERYPDGITIKLSVNYRSTKTIIDTCQSLIKFNYFDHDGPYDQGYFKDVSSRDNAEDGNPISFAEYTTASDEASAVVNTIEEEFLNGAEPGHIFVCARTRAQLGYIEGPLVRAKIPFINICGGSFWGSKHVADVVAYLRLVFNNNDKEALSRVYNIATNWNVYPWGEQKGEYCNHRYLGRAFLDACNSSYTKVWDAVARRKSFKPGVDDLTTFIRELEYTLAQAETPAEIIRQIVDDCYKKYLIADEGIMVSDDAENGKLEDLETVIEVAEQFETVEEFLDYVKETIKAAEAAKNKEWGDYVVLSTVHRLKGLERDTVFVLGCSEGIEGEKGLLPHTFSLVAPKQDGVLPTGGKSRIEDERCIMFVAMSRAKDKVYLSGVREYRNSPMGPSRFIEEIGLDGEQDGIQ